MKLFVDASALVAILAQEDERLEFIDRIGEAEPIYSVLAQWEAANALARLANEIDPGLARIDVLNFAGDFGISLVPIGSEEARVAGEAFARFGKGRHPAQLNMGDCFAYACAKTNGARLLYKGNDFAKTDLA